jgi:hypothetical protein
MTTPTAPAGAPPALWNPNAAACWSLLFTPAFGAFLHARNAESLGRPEEAKANRVWFYVSLAYLGIVLVSIFIPALPELIFRGAAMGILIGWYISLGKRQIHYVRDTWQNRYQRKGWTKPLAVASACFVGFLFACGILGVLASAAFGIE